MNKKFLFTLILITSCLGILGMGIIEKAATASYLFIEEFDVDDTDEVVSREITTRGLKITTYKSRKIEIDFTAGITCENTLKVLLIRKDGVTRVSEEISKSANDEQGGGICEVDDTISFLATGEDETIYIVFLSLVDEKITILRKWHFETETFSQIVQRIENNTVGFAGSNDEIAVKEVKIKIQPVTESEGFIKIENEDLVWSNDRLRIYGTSTLTTDDYFYWTFLDSNGKELISHIKEEVERDGKIDFWIDTKRIDYGKYRLRIDDEFGHSKEFPITLGSEPTTEEINELPVSSSTSLEISESTTTNDASTLNLPDKPLSEILEDLIKWLLQIVILIAILMIIMSGAMYMISAGDQQKADTAKKALTYAILGLAVVALAYAIVDTLVDILT